MFLTSDTSDPLSAGNFELGKRVLAKLKKDYPGVAEGWYVSINPGGVLYVRNTLLAGRRGFCLHVVNLDPGLTKVMKAGGELLERYKVARSRALSAETVLAHLESAPRTSTGDLVAET